MRYSSDRDDAGDVMGKVPLLDLSVGADDVVGKVLLTIMPWTAVRLTH